MIVIRRNLLRLLIKLLRASRDFCPSDCFHRPAGVAASELCPPSPANLHDASACRVKADFILGIRSSLTVESLSMMMKFRRDKSTLLRIVIYHSNFNLSCFRTDLISRLSYARKMSRKFETLMLRVRISKAN